MLNLENLKDNTIIICEKSTQKSLLKELTKQKILKDIKLLTKKELQKKLYFTYNEKAILYLIEKYKYNYEVVTLYLNNLIYLEDKEYKSNKLKHLQSIKNELQEQKLLEKDENFLNLIKNKEIIFYNYDYLDNFDLKIINKLKTITNVKIIEKNQKNYTHQVYELKTIEEEIEFVAQEICKLLEQGININDIKLTNTEDTYTEKIKMIFDFYNLPLQKLNKTAISETEIGNFFLKNYEKDITKTLQLLEETYKEKEIINKIINILNKYIPLNDFEKAKVLIKHDLKNTYINETKYKNQIEIINYNEIIPENYHIFMLNFNQKSIPLQKKDEDYITDNIKDEVALNKTVEINKMIKESTIKNIKNIKNLTITYKKQNGKEECYPSNLIEEMDLKVTNASIDLTTSYSEKLNKIKLSKKLDNFTKYGTTDEELEILNNNYQIPYQKYNNNYQKINKQSMYEYLNNKLNLSYTKMDTYNKCAFAYYISNILKLAPFETNINAKIGSIFHYCLEKGLKEEIDINKTVNNYIKEKEYNFTNKEKFFIEKLKKEIEFVINTIKEQTKYQNLNKLLTEEEVVIKKDKNLKVTFKGIIDKILYNDEGVVAIIDYKTGTTDIKLDLVDYGLSMQLPVYLYLATKSQKIKNPKFAGFYLQQVLNKEITKDPKKTYITQKKEALKLNGYTNENIKLLEKFDTSYENSELIKGLKLTKAGTFSKSSKTITDEEIENLIEKTDQIIDKTIENIENANFDINPKIINGKNKSCEFCKYQDLCFKTPENNIYIQIKKEEEENGLDWRTKICHKWRRSKHNSIRRSRIGKNSSTLRKSLKKTKTRNKHKKSSHPNLYKRRRRRNER